MTESGAVLGRSVAILGGTGRLGRSLGGRLALAGVRVILGSRDHGRAAAAAGAVESRWGGAVVGMLNADAAEAAEITIIAVPWSAHAEVLRELHDALKGKVVVDAVNPLAFDHHGAYPVHVWEGSAAQQAAALLSESIVTSAFHTVAADLLDDPAAVLDSDVLVMSDDAAAARLVQDLVDVVPGLRGVAGGGLRNSQQVEALVANLIAINRSHEERTGESVHAGIRITGLDSH